MIRDHKTLEYADSIALQQSEVARQAHQSTMGLRLPLECNECESGRLSSVKPDTLICDICP